MERVCPKCGKVYTRAPAISRDDNETPICPECGSREALKALGLSDEEIDKIVSTIPQDYREDK